MTSIESKTLNGVANTNKVVAVIVAVCAVLIGLSVWLLRDSYHSVSSDAAYGATAAREYRYRIERLETEHERLAERLDRRMGQVEEGVNDIRLWVAEQRGRESR